MSAATFFIKTKPKYGDNGPDVKVLQGRLKDAGFSPGPLDGIFGVQTGRALKAFQKEKGMSGSGVVDAATLRLLGIALGEGDGASGPRTLPTREQMLATVIGMIEGTIPVKNGPYKIIRETKGKNRSAEIDALIRRQKGGLGQAYCQYGQQEILDELCDFYKVDRSKVKIPEGGGTQDTFKNTPERLKATSPAPMYWVTWRHGDTGSGHVGMCLSSVKPSGIFRTFEFNTTARGDAVIRDGQGAGYCDRKTTQVGDMIVRGYVDVCTAITEAMQ